MFLGIFQFTPLKEVFKNKIEELQDAMKSSENLIKISPSQDGLLFTRGSSDDSIEDQEVLLLEEGDGTLTRKIVLSLPDFGSYEFVFTLGREIRTPNNSPHDFLQFVSEMNMENFPNILAKNLKFKNLSMNLQFYLTESSEKCLQEMKFSYLLMDWRLSVDITKL